ncbi:MAG TPA: TonB-dependent receptor, partial [Opitutaceae bacterium]
EVKGKDVSARSVSNNRSILNLQPDAYRLPDDFPAAQIFEDDSTSYGVVVHLNKLIGDRDPLPINVSVSYNKSDNFQVTNTRRNVYGTPIANPTGETKDYGVLLSTKDGKFSLRAVKYETSVTNANAELSNPAGIGGTIAQGLRFRNVFLYDLALYDWGSRESPQQRNTWGGPAGSFSFPTADSSITVEEGRAREDAAIRTWNEIQAYLTDKGFFEAWGFTPQPLSVLTDRTTYEANPGAYVPPDTSRVFAYVATAPQGFTVTADTESKGYEFELTANPLPNWRVAFNASKTEATRNTVGDADLTELIDFLDSKLYNPDGTPSLAGAMPQFGNTGLSINNNNYNPWHAGYTLMKIQEGAAAPEIRKWRYNVVTNYMFTHGVLKGVGLGASYRWQDKVVIGYPVIQEGARFTYDLSRPYYGPEEDAVDLWASYERKLTDKIRWKIQLNVRNAFAKEELIPISVQPDGQTWASVRIAPNQEWFVTNTFSF